MSVGEAATLLGMSEGGVYSAIRRGDLTRFSASGPVRLGMGEVERFRSRKRDDPSVPPLLVRAAANRLGVSVWAVHKAIDRGELRPLHRDPIRVSSDDVEALRRRRQDRAIEQIGADRLLQLAKDVRLRLHPPLMAPGPRGHAALEGLPERVREAFTMPLLHGASMPEGWSGCRWCAVEMASRMLSVPVRQATLCSEIGLVLLGAPECADHRALVRARMDELAARVHPGGTRPSVARTASVTAAGSAPRVASPVPRRAPAQPVQPDDGGRALVARRLREVRARLKDAKRSGDQRYAIKLRSMVASLEADAAVVDGQARPAAGPAAGPAGEKRCGTPVGVRCSCHPNDGWVKRSAR
jgi:hypothetical protein